MEMETFALLDRLGIPYTWVAHDMANTIEDCAAVDAALGISTVSYTHLDVYKRQQKYRDHNVEGTGGFYKRIEKIVDKGAGLLFKKNCRECYERYNDQGRDCAVPVNIC